MIARRKLTAELRAAVGAERGQQQRRFDLSAGDGDGDVGTLRVRIPAHPHRRRAGAAEVDPRAERRQRSGNAAHRPRLQRRIAGERHVDRTRCKQSGQQPHRRTAVAAIDGAGGRRKRAGAPFHHQNSGIVTAHDGAERAHRALRRAHVEPVGDVSDARRPLGKRGEHHCPVRDRLVTGDAKGRHRALIPARARWDAMKPGRGRSAVCA